MEKEGSSYSSDDAPKAPAAPKKTACTWRGVIDPHHIPGSSKNGCGYRECEIHMADGSKRVFCKGAYVCGHPDDVNAIWQITDLDKDEVAKGAVFRLRRMIVAGACITPNGHPVNDLVITNAVIMIDRETIRKITPLTDAQLKEINIPGIPIYAITVIESPSGPIHVNPEEINISKKAVKKWISFMIVDKAHVPEGMDVAEYLAIHRLTKPPTCCLYRWEPGFIPAKVIAGSLKQPHKKHDADPPSKQHAPCSDRMTAVLDNIAVFEPCVNPGTAQMARQIISSIDITKSPSMIEMGLLVAAAAYSAANPKHMT